MLGKLKGVISKAAPLLGQLVGGPAGGAVGSMIASALDVEPTESAIEKALATDPDAAVKLKQLEADERVRLQELITQQEIAQVQAVNQTMQAESKSEHWPQWAWRPFWGFISGFAFFVVCVFVCILGYQAVMGGQAQAMSMIPQAIGAFTTLFTVPGAILGVSAWHRGKQKRGQ